MQDLSWYLVENKLWSFLKFVVVVVFIIEILYVVYKNIYNVYGIWMFVLLNINIICVYIIFMLIRSIIIDIVFCYSIVMLIK